MAVMLVVDDEKFAVEGIVCGNDWAALGIDSIRTAYHADEAKRIMREIPVDILICDIEMPDEDGLSLVRWVNENSPGTKSLFLTCHSDFAYAKQAINLGSTDYLLKPADSGELAQAVGRMLQAVRAGQEQARYNEMYRKYRQLWEKQQPLLAERFWQDLLSRRILPFGDFLERAMEDAQIGISDSAKLLPILVSIEEWTKPLEERDQEIMEYAVKKAAEELLLHDITGHTVTDKGGVLFVIACGPEGDGLRLSEAGWLVRCRQFIAACEEYFYCRASCYIGRYVLLRELPRLGDALRSMERNNITRGQSALLYSPKPDAAVSPASQQGLKVLEWSPYLLAGDRDKAIDLIHQSVGKLADKEQIKERHMEAWYLDTLQIVYNLLHVKGVSAHQIPQFSVLTQTPVRSLSQYQQWAENLVSTVMEAVFEKREADGVVQKSIQYMKENVEEAISREDVAAHVALNPAYLSRLFKKETGQNLIDFLIEAKMNRAKQLLDATEMTVSAIAQQVGYSNFSHFTKMFKKQFGVNPQEYRKSQIE